MRLMIQADDLTGAADAAAPHAGRGDRVIVVPWRRGAGARVRAADAVAVFAVDTDSRALAAADARSRAMRVTESALAGGNGPVLVFKKIDSRLRGQIAAETEGVLRAVEQATGAPPLCVVAPALPAQRRTTVGGVQLLDGQPVTAAMPADLLAPAPPSSSVLDVLPHSLGGALLLTCRDLARGVETVTAQMAAASSGRTRAIVADAATQDDLGIIAAAAHATSLPIVLVGTAGLSRALAAPHESTAPTPVPGRGPCLMLSLSAAPTAHSQVRHLRSRPDLETVFLEVGAITAGAVRRRAQITATATRVKTVLSHGRHALLTLAGGAVAELSPPAVASAIRTAVLEVLRGVAAGPAPGCILANGGDAAACVCEAFDVDQLEVHGEMEAGVVVAAARRRGGAAVGMVTKSGGFGDAATLSRLLDGVAAGSGVA